MKNHPGAPCLVACLFALALACVFLSGCTSESTPTTVTPAPTVDDMKTTVVVPVDLASDLEHSNIMQKKGVPGGTLIYDGLVAKTRNGTYIPTLAERWEVSPDAKTWTFHLVKYAKWQDGTPVTAADVKFTYDYMKAHNLTMAYVFSDVASVDAPDDYTAVFNLKTSYSVFPDRLAQSPGIQVYPKHIWENIPDPQTYRDTRFLGSGPFRFEKEEPGYFKLTRFNSYYGKKPAITGVVLKLITNKDSQVVALKNGEVDVVSGISPAIAKELEKEPNIAVYPIRDVVGYEVAFNLGMYPTNISAFRKAMSHATDRDTICTIFGSARPTNTTFLMPSVAGDCVNPEQTGMYGYDLEKARTMLAEAGFTKDATGALIGPNGKPVVITIPLGGKGAVNGADQKIVTVLKNDWQKLGIPITTTSYDTESQYKKATDKNPVFIDAMPAVLHDDTDDLVDFAVTPLQETNYYNFNNAEFNTLVQKVRDTVNPVERQKAGYRMQEILAEQVPTVPVCSADTLVAYRKDRFTGWEDNSVYSTVLDKQVLENVRPV
jgi:peptide/nickel transport system substrate-binding protein